MCNIVSGSAYANKWKLSQCCCGCSLRAGSLGIGWWCLVSAILWVINAFRRGSGANYMGLVGAIITLLIGIFILVGIYKNKIKFVWASAYLLLTIMLWNLIMAIVLFVFLIWPIGLVVLVSFALNMYFFLVVRSYGYEAEEAMPRGNPA